MRIKDSIAVVTGGASGIGRALASRFTAEGARHVVVVDIDADGVRRVVGTIAASENADIVANALALLANLAGGASADAVQRDGGAAWAGDMLDVWMDDARICTNAACVLVNVGSVPSQRASEAVVSAQRMHGDDANASQILDAAARLAW